MQIDKYGVVLKRLTEDKLELIRLWRNSPKISKYMEFRETITPEMQINWFKKIDNNENCYFIIVFKDREIGLINIRDIDFTKKCGEAGIYIYEDEFLNSDVSFRSILNLFDYAFDNLQLEYIIAHVLNDNIRAIKYNKTIGFQLQEEQENLYNQLYILTKERYVSKRELIKRLF